MFRYLLLAQIDDSPVAENVILGAIVTSVAALVTALITHFTKVRAEARLRLVDNLIHLAYLGTSEAVRLAKKNKAAPVIDKALYAFRLFDEAFGAEKEPPPSDEEVARAKLTWKALHAQEAMLVPDVKPLPTARVQPVP